MQLGKNKSRADAGFPAWLHGWVQGDAQNLQDQKVPGRGFPGVTAQIPEGCTSPFRRTTTSWETFGAILGLFSPLPSKAPQVVYLTSPSLGNKEARSSLLQPPINKIYY